MYAEPILKAWEKAVGRKSKSKTSKVKTIILAPRGNVFDTQMAKELAEQYTDIVLISGRYEGIDTRVKEILEADEVSVGEYVLTGGELPALTIIDSVARQVPGVLGTFESLEEERVSSGEMYTRPEVLTYKKKQYRVPLVLLTGNHADIEKWRQSRFDSSE
jgi:tRNA (guanine37-N1)-methyltransferase